MLNVYIDDRPRYFVGNTITKEAGETWERSIADAINKYNDGIHIVTNHPVFRKGSKYTLHMKDIENNYPELLI